MQRTLDRSAVRQLLRSSEGCDWGEDLRWEKLTPAESCWVLELRAGSQAVLVELAPIGTTRALRSVGGLQLSYRSGDGVPTALGVDSCDRVASLLDAEQCAGPWAMPPRPTPGMLPQPERVLERVPVSALGEEGRLLETDLSLYAFHFGEPSAYRVAEDAFTLHFPSVKQASRPANRQLNSAWLSKPALRTYLEDLGFRWDIQGFVDTVPTPRSLSRLLSRAGVPQGFHGQLTRTKLGLPLTDSRWVSHLMQGIFPTPVNFFLGYLDGQAFTRAFRSHLGFTPCGMLAHDMSIHLLVTHRVPPAAVERYRRLIEDAIPRRSLRWLAPSAVIRFFEDLLTTECQELWEQVESPAAFDAAFAEQTERLEERLRRCVRVGLGDGWKPLRRVLR